MHLFVLILKDAKGCECHIPRQIPEACLVSSQSSRTMGFWFLNPICSTAGRADVESLKSSQPKYNSLSSMGPQVHKPEPKNCFLAPLRKSQLVGPFIFLDSSGSFNWC